MSRKKRVIRKRVYLDPKYKSASIGKLINFLMLQGKKTKAVNIVYRALDILREKSGEDDGLKALTRAIDNIKPTLEVRSRRVGGATYQVPVDVAPERQLALAYRWIIGFARSKKGKSMHEKLALELIDAYNKTGSAVKKKEDTHKMAEGNRAFAHYQW